MGKIPRKIVSCFDGFNADEYKNWLLYFSLFSLKGIIPSRDLECFRKFVIACCYICKKSLSRADIDIANGFLLNFCKSFESIYGSDRVTPNMHLHLHLKQCILDYGPIHGFWLFSFERYNGMLGMLPTNKKNIELQIMNRFISENLILNLERPTDFADNFQCIFADILKLSEQRGTLLDISNNNKVGLTRLSSRLIDPSQQKWYEVSKYILPLSKLIVHTLSSREMEALKDVLKFMYPSLDLDNVIIPESCHKCFKVSYNHFIFGSASSNPRSSFITAYWCTENGDIYSHIESTLQLRPGAICYFVRHYIKHNDQYFEHWFAFCEWFHKVADEIKHKFGKPLQVWHRSLFEMFGRASFIPVGRIHGQFVFAPFTFRSQDLMVVIPKVV